MNKTFFATRKGQLISLFFLLLILLIGRLFVLTVLEHEEWSKTATRVSTRTIYTTAPRGEIYDRYGRLIAGEQQSFSVRISDINQDNEQVNDTIEDLILIFEKNEDEYGGEFPITIENSTYRYNYREEIEGWLVSKGFPKDLSAEAAFNALRTQLGIDPSLDRYQAQLEMQNNHNQYPPISVTEMDYLAKMENDRFLERYFPDEKNIEDKSAEEVFKEIREILEIDEDLSDREALKIMDIRNAMKEGDTGSYIPTVIARGVSDATVMEIQENKDRYQGVEVVSEPIRYYPNNNTAAHIIGYLGELSEEQEQEYEDRGYEPGALIGQEGIEGAYEAVLKGENGEKIIQVDALGEFQQEIRKEEQKKGKDIYLTIDLKLQDFAEDTLENTLAAIRSGGSVPSEYGALPIAKASPNAETGAVVVLEAKTGDVLALASYPDYNPNLFTDGISQKDWDGLQSKNPRNPLAPAPLYNIATMSAVQPGSTFKPLTALTALSCGLDPEASYRDDGKIEMGERVFGCVAWTLFKGNHGYINLARALEVSCNYYFFDIATGKDWATGESLGYDEEISLEKITAYAEEFGLGEPTGIEIDETVIPVPSEERKVEGLANTFGYNLYANAEEYFTEKVVKNPEQLDKNIAEMKSWMSEPQVSWNYLYNTMLPQVGIKESKRTKIAELFLYDLYPQAEWQVSDAFNIGIGQGENAYTPLQIANYIATIGNEGEHHEVSLVKSIEGQGTLEKDVTRVSIDEKAYYDAVIQGMKQAATGDESAERGIFRGLDYTVALKTGTAERTGKINPPSEVDYIKENLDRWDPDLNWQEVSEEMDRLMKEYPDTYTTKDVAVRRAVINLSDRNLTGEILNQYKSDYAEFAWIVAMAPADDPEVVVCALIPQGETSGNAAPIAKNVLSKYFDLEKEYSNFKVENLVE